MPDEKNVQESAGQAGSSENAPISGPETNPNDVGGSAGQPESKPTEPAGTDETVPKTQYEDLEKKMGEQSTEVGTTRKENQDYKNFFQGIAPLLDKLDKSPELVQAIVDDKVTEELAKAILEGKVTMGDAETVTEAHKEVKKDLSKKEYEAKTPEEIEKMVEDKVAKATKSMENKIGEQEKLAEYKTRVDNFISETSDFEEHAKEIGEWIDKHPGVSDVEVAYYAVKGKISEVKAKEEAQKNAGEAAKDLAANAAGGGGNITNIPSDDSIVDTLIAPKANPNLF